MSAERITRADLARALEQHRAALNALPWPTDRGGVLLLEEGSKTYGRAYRLYETCYDVGDPDGRLTTGHAEPRIGGSFLGMTASEAYERLTDRTRVLWDVADAMRQAGADGEGQA